MEDAGYNPKTLAETKTGIFVGAEPTGYLHQSFTGASDAIIASRLSYFLNLRGPAFVVNTGCSSSGVAIHLACESLRNQETNLALTGGVFAVMGPTPLVGLAQTEMLSFSGRCHSFDAEADGMVMSEGVAMLTLKRLDDAIADGDAIYGVIKASGMNQDGASNGITAPNGLAQEALISEVYRRYRIDPERIGYMEAHGTGTKLGDPVEANALVRAFRQFTDKQQYCAVGSSKAHIGHTTASAAAIGLIKVLLSLKHHKIPGLPYFKKLNPLIEFDRSAFYPATGLVEWSSSDGRPLMAGLSSFGHSGTNVHIVVEEYVFGSESGFANNVESPQTVVVVLSAKNDRRLHDVVANLLAFVRGNETKADKIRLADLAYTLQSGREAMEHRVAFLASSLDELVFALSAIQNSEKPATPYWTGSFEGKMQKVISEPIAEYLINRDLAKLAEAWCKGHDIAWEVLYGEKQPRRMHLPSYPFAKERYWKPEAVIPTPDLGNASAYLHPLLHRNTSTVHQLCFSSTWTGEEFFLSDHQVQGQKVLPAVAYLEMARVAVAHATGRIARDNLALKLTHILWTRPLAVSGQGQDAHIRLFAEDGNRIRYEIYTQANTDAAFDLHGQGLAVLDANSPVADLDLNRLQAETNQNIFTPEQCQAVFNSQGINFGQGHKGLASVQVGNGQVLAKLVMPLSLAETSAQFVLHPALLDAALQSSVALALAEGIGNDRVLLPYALEELVIANPCSATLWAWIRRSANCKVGDNLQKLDIDFCDGHGRICVQMRGFSSRLLAEKSPPLPLLQSDSSTPEAPCYRTRFTGDEYFLKDHSGMLPGAVYLALVREAGDQLNNGGVAALKRIVWLEPMHIRQHGGDLAIRLKYEGDQLNFEAVGVATKQPVVFCQGELSFAETDINQQSSRLVIEPIRSRCQSFINKTDCDELLQGTHGPGLMSINSLRYNDVEALAELEIPHHLKASSTGYALHPSLLNGAILAGVAWTLLCQVVGREGGILPMPFSLDELQIVADLPDQVYAYIQSSDSHEHRQRLNNAKQVDIILTDMFGTVRVVFRGFTLIFPQNNNQNDRAKG